MITHHHWIVDAGHAWYAVSLDELEELGITDEISKYSYYNAGMVYLEEDCDFEVYRNAVIKSKGHDDAVVGIFNDHCIDGDWKGRNYSRMGDSSVRLLLKAKRTFEAGHPVKFEADPTSGELMVAEIESPPELDEKILGMIAESVK
tara:strand:- start:4851 stop:5288 length:438 start_codon:yes stop_codon:yes gene_type:complete